MSVREWPTYLLRDIPEHVRTAIEEDAEREERSLAETMREILCSHYDLDCDPVETFGRRDHVKGTGTMLLRVQPELFQAIKADAGSADTAYGSPRGEMHRIITAILSDYYNGGTPNGN